MASIERARIACSFMLLLFSAGMVIKILSLPFLLVAFGAFIDQEVPSLAGGHLAAFERRRLEQNQSDNKMDPEDTTIGMVSLLLY